jgi:hypothetical protein
MSSSQYTYFVNVDGLYRDTAAWPNPTDFGINFTTFSGTGIYVQGEPLNSNSFFQQASIDPDYIDNNLQFVNATIQQLDRTADTLTISGLFNFQLDFKIKYLENTLYIQTGTYYPPVTQSPYSGSVYAPNMIVPFLCQLEYDANATVPYSLSWNAYIKPSIVPLIYYNVSFKSGFQTISNGDYYWLFDFSLRQFDFFIYKNGLNNYLTSAFNPTIDPRRTPEYNGNYGYICACLALISQDGDIGISNKHAYGYHIFSNIYNVGATELNGSNSLLVDQSDNALVSLNVDPFTYVCPRTTPDGYTRAGLGALQGLGYLYEETENPTCFFENASGTVMMSTNQIAFSPNLVNFGFGPYTLAFLLDDPTDAYMRLSYTVPEPAPTGPILWVNSGIVFTGPAPTNQLFYWNSSIPNLVVSAPTGTNIFTLDRNTFATSYIQSVPTTGAASCAFAQTGAYTYLFSQNISNYMDVYTFDTSTYAVTRITGVQIVDSYIFARFVFTIRRGTDIFIFSSPKSSGNSPVTYWLLTESLTTVLKFDTLTNTLTVINQFLASRDIGYNAMNLSLRPSGQYWYKLSGSTNRIDIFDITNPYSVVKRSSIDCNAVNTIYSYKQTILGATKYYIILTQIGGGQNSVVFDLTDVNNPVKLGKNITANYLPIGDASGINNGYWYGRQSFSSNIGGSISVTAINFFKRERLPNFDQRMISSQYSQNIALTIASISGAVRCATFNLNDQAYVAVLSNTLLRIYDITAVRSTYLVSSISVSFSTTIYDMQTVNYNDNQYFMVVGLGFVITFILLPTLTSIVYTGVFTAVPDAYAECKFFTFNNNLFALVSSYTSRIYRFAIVPSLTLTNPPFLTIAGKIPAIVMVFYASDENKQFAIVTTSNFATANDTYFFFDVGTSLIFLGAPLVTAPGAMPRSGTQIVSPLDAQTYGAGYANVGWGILRPFKGSVVNSGFTYVNTQAVNIPTNLNGFTRMFYTDQLYVIVNQYGGPGTFGDYITCFSFEKPDYGIRAFRDNILSVGTGASTGSPLVNIDMRISQLGDRTTLCTLNSNNTLYLYDISNPDFAGKSQTLNLVSETTSFPTNFGSSYVYKLTNEGLPVYNNSIRFYNTGTSVNGALINSSNIKISKDNLSVYVGGGFNDQIQLFNPGATGPVNQISAIGQNYNGYVAKFDAITGQWAWILPFYGNDDDYLFKMQYISSLNRIGFCGYTKSSNMIFYQKQTSGSLVNPIIFQANIPGSISTTNGFLVSVDSNGVVNWTTNSFSDESSSNVNFLDLGYQGDQLIVSGYTNSKIVQTIDGTGLPVQNLYSQVANLGQNSLVSYTFNTSGKYLRSFFTLLPELTQGFPTDIKIFSDLNLTTYAFFANYQSITQTEYFNKDGTLAHTDDAPSNTTISYVVDYKNDSQFTDTNGSKYSIIQLATPPSYPFTGGFMTNYSMYILGTETDVVLNKDFSIRNNYESPTGVYNIILNSSIDTSLLDRQLFSVNGITGSNTFYNINISTSPLYKVIKYNIDAQPTVNNTITTVGLDYLDTTLTYYLTFPKNGAIYSLIVESVTQNSAGDYVLQLLDVNELRIVPFGPFYGPYLYLTQFNQNVYYNLQFNPATIIAPVYYGISLQSITIPNRPLRQKNKQASKLTKMPYIYLAIFCVDSNLEPDSEIVNIVYDNNPNREQTAIFQIPTVEVGNEAYYVTLRTTTVPRIKFLPRFNTLRFQLLDRFGEVILFDNTPYKVQDAEYKGGVVPPELMNISIQFTLVKLNI